MKRGRIVLISSGQPSLNPRLVKEADTLTKEGYEVFVIYQYWNAWATALDKQLLKEKKWQAILAGGNPNSEKNTYLLARVVQKAAKMLSPLFNRHSLFTDLAAARSTAWLTSKAKSLKADLYIAHNLGALPAAVKAARKYGAKCGFDAEDFHRNEVSDNPHHPDVKLKKAIEDHYLPLVDQFTVSSGAIGEQYKQLYPELSPQTILNVFPICNAKHESPLSETLRLCWFSQTIGTGRGLETVINALGELRDLNIELHLLGDLTDVTIQAFETIAHTAGMDTARLIYHPPVLPDAVFDFAAKFDIGLALETGRPLNRDICLTNKIFTYMVAGCAVIATDTTAQTELLAECPGIGSIYKNGDAKALKEIINHFYTNRDALIAAKEEARLQAETRFNWEIEQIKFLEMIKSTLIQ